MVVGYEFLCEGLKEPMSVKGETYDECYRKFQNYWSSDYDVNPDEIISVKSIDVKFDIL